MLNMSAGSSMIKGSNREIEMSLPPVVFSSALRPQTNLEKQKPRFSGSDSESSGISSKETVWYRYEVTTPNVADLEDRILDRLLRGRGSGSGSGGGDVAGSISFLGNVGIGTTQPAYRLDVQNGSARFSKTRIMPVTSIVGSGSTYTLTMTYPPSKTMIYGEFRGYVADSTNTYATSTHVRISFKIVNSGSSSFSLLGDVSLLGSTSISVSMTGSSSTSTTIQVNFGSSTGSWTASGDLLLVESENAIVSAKWS